MKNDKKRADKEPAVANTYTLPSATKWTAGDEVAALKALQDKAKLLSRGYQYGGYQGL